MARKRNSLINQREINYSLRKTFEFIQSHLLAPNGQILSTTLYLKVNLNESQSSGSNTLRKDSSNMVTGYISFVTATTVTIHVPTKCEGIFTSYTVQLSKIIQIISGSILIYFNEYLAFMEKLPPLCEEEQLLAENILSKFSQPKVKAQASQEILLRIIFDGVKSRAIAPIDVTLVRNLFILGDYIMIPYSFIGGYSIYLSCPTTEVKTLTEDNAQAPSTDLKAAEIKEDSSAPEVKDLNLGGIANV